MENIYKVDEILKTKSNKNTLIGAVAMIYQRDNLLHTTVVGYQDYDAQIPMRANSIFRIASMTKPITSVATLMLIEEGKLGLHDPITRWLPEFADMHVLTTPDGPLDVTEPAQRELTVEDLLTHRAGMGYSFTLKGPIAHKYYTSLGDVDDCILGPDEWLAQLGQLPLIHQPGAQFSYGHATDVLGFLIARAEGSRLSTILAERLFKPLNMIDTDFFCRDSNRMARRYNFASGQPVDATLFRTEPMAYESGGGGLYSTAADYLKFTRMLLDRGQYDGKQLLSPESVALMTQNHLTDAQRAIPMQGLPFWSMMGFGLGVSVVTDSNHPMAMGGDNGSIGWPGAFGTWWQADPANDIIIIYLIQDYVDMSPEGYWKNYGTMPPAVRLVQPMLQRAIYDRPIVQR